jgi:site-specific DNA recombinase
MRVFTYSRYSTDRQSEASIADQQRRCHEFAASRGWPIAADYTDEAISGAAFGNRPGWQRLAAELRAGDVLVVMELSRICRSQELAPLMDRLRFRGVRVFSIVEGFDSTSSHARMQAGLSGLMSDEFRASIRARTHSALHMRARDGRPTGGKAYGYDAAGQVLEAEAAIVREVFARSAAGESTRSIANDLNVRGVPSPGAEWSREVRRRDGRWLMSAVHAMLGNERYIGRLIWNRSTWVKDPDSGKRMRRERPPSEWIVTECPALVDGETWERVQVRLRERSARTGGHGARRRRYLLSGLLTCEVCGARFIVTGKGGSHYECASHSQGGPAACPVGACVRRDVAEAAIREALQVELLAPDAVTFASDRIRAWARGDAADAAPGASPELAELDGEIADLEALIDARPARAATLRQALEDLRRRRDELQRAARQRAIRRTVADVPAEAVYRAVVAELVSRLEGRNVEAGRAALRAVVGDISVLEHDGKPYGRIRLDWAALFRDSRVVRFSGSGGRI